MGGDQAAQVSSLCFTAGGRGSAAISLVLERFTRVSMDLYEKLEGEGVRQAAYSSSDLIKLLCLCGTACRPPSLVERQNPQGVNGDT